MTNYQTTTEYKYLSDNAKNVVNDMMTKTNDDVQYCIYVLEEPDSLDALGFDSQEEVDAALIFFLILKKNETKPLKYSEIKKELTEDEKKIISDNEIWESFPSGCFFQKFRKKVIKLNDYYLVCGSETIYDDGFPCECIQKYSVIRR
jgi:hypothetical protein